MISEMKTKIENPYLIGKYAPVYDEIAVDNLPVIGEIPRDLNGVYVRNGPNPRYQPKGRYHWFDGDGMLHAVHFENGHASYRNRWIRTEAFQRETVAGDSLWTGVLENPVNNPGDMRLKDTANTDVIFHNNHLMALWYLSGKPYKIDARTLETLGVEDFQGKFRARISAHAKVDLRTGEMMFFDYAPRPPFMWYGVSGADGLLKHFVPIELPGARMPHDMAITEHYSILMDLPLFADPEAAKAGRYKARFFRDLPSRFGIIARHGAGDTVKWFDAAPCYIYHSVNAWEEGDEIVMLACRVDTPEPPAEITGDLNRMLAYLRLDAHLYEWRFNLRTGQTRERSLDDENTEFPTVNNYALGCHSRFAYNVHINSERTLLFDGLTRYDLQQKRSDTFWFGEGRFGSEAPLAPRPNAHSEDDGYIVSFVHDERENQSEVIILDAQNVTAGPIGRVLIPQRVPLGFHACWVAEAQLPETAKGD